MFYNTDLRITKHNKKIAFEKIKNFNNLLNELNENKGLL